QEDRHEDDDDLGPFQRPSEYENDRLRQDHELHGRHIERQHPLLDQRLPAEDCEDPREQRRANEQPAHHGGGLRRQEHSLLGAFPVERPRLDGPPEAPPAPHPPRPPPPPPPHPDATH